MSVFSGGVLWTPNPSRTFGVDAELAASFEIEESNMGVDPSDSFAIESILISMKALCLPSRTVLLRSC